MLPLNMCLQAFCQSNEETLINLVSDNGGSWEEIDVYKNKPQNKHPGLLKMSAGESSGFQGLDKGGL